MRRKRELYIALAASFLLHLIFIFVSYLYFDSVIFNAEKEEVIAVDLTDKYDIADIAQPKFEERPEKAKHLGLYDSKVKDETVASETVRAPGRPGWLGGEDVEKIKKHYEKSDREGYIEESSSESKKEAPNRLFSKIPEDFYPDYKRGDHTFINVLKHPDVQYFVRLKRVFKLAWDPTGVLMNRRITGEVSRGSIKTMLGITIDNGGEIEELFVINGSGMDDYDNEALRAVRVSAPFSAPPKNLLTADSKLRIVWTFVVYL